jgi:hypothetical protein
MRNLVTATVVLMLLAAAFLTGCQQAPVVYRDNPWTADPAIQTVAIAPFLVKSDIAMTRSQSFASMSLGTSDGAPAFYSIEFADAFAAGLTKFPGLTVIKPESVHRAWIEAEGAGDPNANPLANRENALKIARRLGADSILVGEVLEWDPYVPRVTIDWSLHYTKSHTATAMDVKMLESAGKGGFMESRKLGAGQAVFAQQLTLDAESVSTKDMMKTYEWSLDPAENAPYSDPGLGVFKRPFPRFVRFAAWAAVSGAFRYFEMSHAPAKPAASGASAE